MATPHGFVGMYDFKETLGKGHFSVVKVAEHVISKQRVAIKIIEKCKLEPIELEHLHQEVRVMKLLRHPHVVRLYEVVDTTARLYLILELGTGGDLYENITKAGARPEAEARSLFQQLTCAMDYCHRHHIAHRDLKPENVVFCKGADKTDVIKVTDFGLSNSFNPGEMMETMVGSLCYSAPEVLLQDPYDGPAADVWSLGVMLFMLVCGKQPFNEHSDAATLIKILDCTYTIPDHVSQPCQDLIRHMLVREPSKRLTLSQIIAHEWVGGPQLVATAASPSIPPLTQEEREAVLGIMAQANFRKEDVLEAIEKQDYNHIASTYYLLAERQIRNRGRRRKDSASSQPSSPTSSPPSSPTPTGSARLRRHNTMHMPRLEALDGETDTDAPQPQRVVSTGRHTGSLASRGLGRTRTRANTDSPPLQRVVPTGRHTGSLRARPRPPPIDMSSLAPPTPKESSIPSLALSPRYLADRSGRFKIPDSLSDDPPSPDTVEAATRDARRSSGPDDRGFALPVKMGRLRIASVPSLSPQFVQHRNRRTQRPTLSQDTIKLPMFSSFSDDEEEERGSPELTAEDEAEFVASVSGSKNSRFCVVS